MKYVSIDTETTGLDPCKCVVIEFAAVIDDTERPDVPVEELPAIRRLLRHDIYPGEAAAMAMHSDLFREIAAGGPEVVRPAELRRHVLPWLRSHGIERPFAAGKNFAGFDLRFLRRMKGWDAAWNSHFMEAVVFHHRTLDPTMFFLRADDEVPPSMGECLRRAGLADSVSHRALDDARDVVRLIRAGLKLAEGQSRRGEKTRA